MVFPVAKLVYLAMKQVSKPLARALQARAKTSPIMKNYLLIPPAQIYHSMETNVRLRLLNMGKAKDIKPLDPELAVELGAEMLGEILMFTVGAGIIYLEYSRQANNAQAKEDVQNSRLRELEQEVRDMLLQVETHNAEVRSLLRLLHDREDVPSQTEDKGSGTRLEIDRDGIPTKIVSKKSGTVLEVQK